MFIFRLTLGIGFLLAVADSSLLRNQPISHSPSEEILISQIRDPADYETLEQFRRDFETRFMAAGSMQPTLEVGDKILIDKHSYRSNPPKRGDIIMFEAPREAIELVQTENSDPEPAYVYIKRIVGLPGEIISIRDGNTYINGRVLHEDYVDEPSRYTVDSYQIPEDAYFVLGDYRNASSDSHVFGALSKDLVRGKVIGVYCPVENQGWLNAEAAENALNQAMLSFFLDLFRESPGLCSLQPGELNNVEAASVRR